MLLLTRLLLESLKEAEKPYNSVKGCIVYILFWFAEVTHSISKNESELGKCKPRFARWNTRMLAEKIMNDGMISLKQDSLMTPIEIRQTTLDRILEKKVRDGDRDEYLDLSPDSDLDGESDEDWEFSLDIDSDGEGDEAWEWSPGRNASRRLEDLAHVYLSKKRKISRKESHPPDGKGICNAEPENLPLSEPTMPSIPILLTQESGATENETDVLQTTVNDLHGNDVHIESFFLSCSEEHTTGVESLEVGSTSTYAQGRVEEFEFVDYLKIPEEYKTLYKKIYDKYGHMASRKVINFNDDMLLTCVTCLLKIISDMETVPGAELSEDLLQRWERFIKDASWRTKCSTTHT
ncbi:hypothetical protein C5167_008881, partial [Papaver somniferum]